MTTVEKVLVQIFERKYSIIEQVKQQTELYSQHLASKSLINGITPPSWLWNPNTSDSEELNKEELISKLLHPYPQPSAAWSFVNYPGYSNLVITGDNEELSDRVSAENPSCSKGPNRQEDPTGPALHIDDHAEWALNCAPELDASFYSPEDQTDERILNIYNAPDQSLAGIKRSKSRQKALELRSNAKGTAKSGLICEDNGDVCSSQIRFPLFATDQTGQDGELPQVAEPCPVGGQSCEESYLDEAVHTSREMGEKALELCSNAKALARSAVKYERNSDVVSSQIRYSLSATDQAGPSDKLPQLAEHCAAGIQSCEEMNLDEADLTGRDIKMVTYSDIITRSRTEIPVSVEGSFTLGCSSEDRKEKAFCHVSKARRSETMPPHSEHADNYIKLPKSAGPSTICCRSGGDRSVDGADFLSKDKGTSFYTGRISRERQSCCSDFSKAASSSGNNQGVDTGMMDSGNNILPDCVDESFPEVNLRDVPNKYCGIRESISGDFNRHKEQRIFPSFGSIQHNACVDEVSDLEISSVSAKVDGGILGSSSVVSASKVNDSHEVSGLATQSGGLFHRLTRSQSQPNDEAYHPVANNEKPSFSGKIFPLDCKQKLADELQNSSSGQSVPACHVTHNLLHDDNNSGLVMVRELVLHDHVDQSCSPSYSTKQRRELESQVAPTLRDSSAFVEPKQFDCKETEGYNLKAFASESEKEKLDNSPKTVSVPEVDSFLGKGTCDSAKQLGEQPLEMSVVSIGGHKSHRDSFESDVQMSPEDNTEVGLSCNLADKQIRPVNFNVEHRRESSPLRDLEEGNSEEEDKGQLVSSAPEGKKPRLSHYHSSAKESRAESYGCLIDEVKMTNPIAPYDIEQFAVQQSQVSSCLEGEVHTQHGDSSLGNDVLGTHSTLRLQGENSLLERRFTPTSTESWPQIKRRKIEHQQAHSFATFPGVLVKRGPASLCLGTMEINVDTAFMEHIHKSRDVRSSPQTNTSLMKGIESTLLPKHGEVESCHKENNEDRFSWSGINNEQLEATLLSSLTFKESRNSQGCNPEEVSVSNNNLFDTRMSGGEQFCEHSCHLEKNVNNLSSEKLKTSSTLLEGIQYPKGDGGQHAQQSVLPLNNEDMRFTDVDQSVPVFERFMINGQTATGELNFAADGLDVNGLKLSLERASIIAEICKSASLDRSSCQFLSDFEFQGTQNLFQSLPNGCHLEHFDLGDTCPVNSDVGKHIQSGSSSSDRYRNAIDGMPHSVSLAYSGARYGWSLRSQQSSPVGNLWDRLDRLSSHSGSSEKRLSSNPGLTCFPIEEDPSISEENRTMDENTGDMQEEIDSSLAASQIDKRQPLKDLTNVSLNLSVSAEEETSNTDGVDFVRTSSVTGMQENVRKGPEYRYRNKSETSKIQTSSTGGTDVRKNQRSFVGANGIKKAKESINNSISRPVVSNKTSLKGQKEKNSLRGSTRTNIVSNVTSFITLMQQKQAATACDGKRDVKVKALEAAENAKRLEEKKEIERKLRKEALKLERAKLEEKNLRNMELEKKRKEEERKKKDADIVSKKRLREEEERKEKEKKRMRLEARQRQREQEEQKRAEKAEKENQRAKDEQMNRKKEFHNEPKKQQNRETAKGDKVALQKAETKLALTGVVMNEGCGTSEAETVMHAMDKSPRNKDLISQNSQGKSYEISPYQCSDDEDEEDDGLPTKKYIPSWASKSSVALFLPLQQDIDPDVVFLPESFCSMDEVLLPRKLQKSQVAA